MHYTVVVINSFMMCLYGESQQCSISIALFTATLLIHGGHAANVDVIAIMIWEKSSCSRRQKNAVARVLRFSKKDFFFRTQIET